jgi:hypothetical protein
LNISVLTGEKSARLSRVHENGSNLKRTWSGEYQISNLLPAIAILLKIDQHQLTMV